MDPEQLRWTLLVIGSVLIVAVYLFGRHQSKLRNRAAIKTYTQEELEDPYIDDDTLRRELQNLDGVMSDDEQANLEYININPGIEAEYTASQDELIFIKDKCETAKHLVSYLLKKQDGTFLFKNDVHTSLMSNGFLTKTKDVYLFFNGQQELFSVAIRQDKTSPSGKVTAICFIMDQIIHRKNANKSYETMLKIIDTLTNQLGVKVYNQNQSLLSIDDVTLIRQKLLKIDD